MKATLIQATVIGGLALVFAVGSAYVHPKRPPWYKVIKATPWDLRVEKIREVVAEEQIDQILWVDARKEKAFEKGHMEGAILILKENLGESLVKHQDALQAARDKPVIVYCDGRGCERSQLIAEKLRGISGLEPVYVLKGDWRKFK